MKIGIDARMLGTGYGIGRYVEQLVKHLAIIDKENEYVLFVKKIQNAEFRMQNVGTNFEYREADIPWYSWEEQVKFSGIIKKEKIDLMHFPHWNVPILYNDPFVVTIHDLTMYHYPRPEATTLGPLKFWLKDRAHRFVVQRAVKRARHIITTSEFTKQDVHKTLGIWFDRMTTIYQAPFEEGYKIQETKYKQILEKYTINRPYVLYVGAAYPHKNAEGLLEAWKIFEEKYGDEYQLVFVGKEDYFYQRIKKLQVTSYPPMGDLPKGDKLQVTFTGLVPDDELATLYQHASLFVFPSLYEGFGLPPLEAMAQGVPVVASNRSSVPEVCGEAALYFDPENYEQMADTLHRGLTDENLRFELKERAMEELKRFSWDDFAQRTLQVYQ